jgi:hypothetical protein
LRTIYVGNSKQAGQLVLLSISFNRFRESKSIICVLRIFCVFFSATSRE